MKKCDREDIVDKCMFNVKMVTDNDEAVMAHNQLRNSHHEDGAFIEENNVTNKSLTRDYSIDVNVDESEYKENSFNESERLDEIREENEGIRGVRDYLKEEEYEREEQKYVAEEKEFASYQEESRQVDNNIITQRSEDYLHEEMKKMSVEESRTMSYGDGEVKMQTESRMEEAFENKEKYNSEVMETKHMQMDDNLIVTETKEEFAAETHETRHYEEAEIVRGKIIENLDTFLSNTHLQKH